MFWNYDFQTVFRTTELSTNSLGDLVVLWNYDVHTVFHTGELSTNSLGDFVVFGNYDFQTVFHTAELSTNSLGDFVMFWNYDFHTVSTDNGAFNEFPGGCFGIMISNPFSTQRSFQPIPGGILWCFRIVISIPSYDARLFTHG